MSDFPWTEGPWTHAWAGQHCAHDCIVDAQDFHVCQPPVYGNCQIIALTPDMAEAILQWKNDGSTEALDIVGTKIRDMVQVHERYFT